MIIALQTLKSHEGQYIDPSSCTLRLHNSPTARELFKRSTDSASFLVYFKKLISVLCLGLVVGDVITRACFRAFVAEVTWPWAPTQQGIFLAQVRFGNEAIIRESRALIGFLAYLDPYHGSKTKNS